MRVSKIGKLSGSKAVKSNGKEGLEDWALATKKIEVSHDDLRVLRFVSVLQKAPFRKDKEALLLSSKELWLSNRKF